jgi:integrase
MEDYFSPEEIRTLISRCDSDRQRIVLFLLYNYGLSVAEAAELKAGQFMLKPDYILFNFSRRLTGKSHTYKIQFENSRLLYRVLSKLQDHEPLLHKDKNLPISESIIKKDLFDLAVTMNRKITDAQLFESHLFWLFRKGVSFAQAVEEYGLALSGKPFKIWENAMLSGRLWPVLLD